ncbi:MAG: hypothetical protein JO121_04845 [Deltaproteobacteria bacterium]|nr:hypothetical protein [Deltaproteobacteria bacterium]
MLFNLANIVQPRWVALTTKTNPSAAQCARRREGKDMKRYAALAGTPIFAAILGQITPAEAENIPQPSGVYSTTIQGSVAQCFDPSTHAPETCSTSGALVVAFSVLQLGHITYSSGIACEEITLVVSGLPPNASPPIVSSATGTAEITNYDPTTGIGTSSFTRYSGGSCSGANFNSEGATETSFGTLQFVVTDGGKQDSQVVTQLEGSPTNNVGSVSLSITEQKQTR